MGNCSQVNTTEPHRWEVNTGSGTGSVEKAITWATVHSGVCWKVAGARSSAGRMLTGKIDIHSSKFQWLSRIPNHLWKLDDIIQNGQRDLKKLHGTSSVNISCHSNSAFWSCQWLTSWDSIQPITNNNLLVCIHGLNNTPTAGNVDVVIHIMKWQLRPWN